MVSEQEQMVNGILRSLKKKGATDEVLSKVAAVLSSANIRPVRVLAEICEHGEVSTEDLTKKYGYNQPPRAARDLRELGFNIRTSSSRTTTGRRMAVYSLGSIDDLSVREGRILFSKRERQEVISRQRAHCYYCAGKFAETELQIDHRVPFEIAGNSLHERSGIDALIAVCSSCNRRKSWSCESCGNFKVKDIAQCITCYWYSPDEYQHVGGKKRVVLSVTFDGNDPLFKVFKGQTREQIETILRKKLL